MRADSSVNSVLCIWLNVESAFSSVGVKVLSGDVRGEMKVMRDPKKAHGDSTFAERRPSPPYLTGRVA